MPGSHRSCRVDPVPRLHVTLTRATQRHKAAPAHASELPENTGLPRLSALVFLLFDGVSPLHIRGTKLSGSARPARRGAREETFVTTLLLILPPLHWLLEGLTSGLVALANYVGSHLPRARVRFLDLGQRTRSSSIPTRRLTS